MLLETDIINDLPERYRVQLINSLSGYKSANLIGSCNAQGLLNLALFSSVFHVGASPALIGLLSRPDSVPRHTLENIRATGEFTVNSVSTALYRQAHLCSARSDRSQSEFDFAQLTPQFKKGHRAPAVQQSPLSIYLTLREITPIEANNTVLIIGQVQAIELPQQALSEDGFIDHQLLDTICVSGLDSYHKTQPIARLGHAKMPTSATEA
ncbi:hypothetical protein SIN8267_03049 [Sinobacterium norvegicum]|uniref:Flavin reductase like domain-containing protein n=1 Tax=Sinobacterium norvegicum TaxID=1641715 RepID=A0ABN8ENV5_9GAMM|nr:flavin reductase [Sinobacterium norvegicum]CAH0992910.1 hypothetical protein SIN8267_03049 [Sinobacterium norvegicum]